MSNITIPKKLIQRIKYDYAAEMYKEGIFAVPSLNDKTIEIVLSSALTWMEENGEKDITSFMKEG